MDLDQALKTQKFRSDEQAARYYYTYANKGEPYAQYVIGLLLEEGKGIE